ncbi:MAG: calcium/sodium antiporter [Burkholderiaceae bacterium]|nr:calcium/sodium antiporter [Burkholderiaceae bacterium]
MTALLFAAGLAGLVAGAELLVRGATKLALSFGVSPLVVGLTVVAFGTSAPELAVSVGAAMSGQTELAVGNVVGSNIFNVLVILGLSALITPLLVDMQLIRQEVPIMIGASVLLLVLSLDGRIGLADAAMLLVLQGAYTVFLVRQSRAQNLQAQETVYDDELGHPDARAWDARLPAQIGLIAVGLALLVGGSQALVSAAVTLAKSFGVSDLVIGLTIVAAGTSLPEVAASLMAALRGQRDIAVGNVVGSNLFNILGCLGLAGLVSGQGLPVPAAALDFDLWVMLAAALACLPVFISGRQVARWEGGVFLAYYAAYVSWLVLTAQQHPTVSLLAAAMLGFVLPLTVITLFVVLLLPARR